MHNALDVPELYEQILGHCRTDPSSLASLARTRRSFSEQTIKHLYQWHEVHLEDLVKCCLPNIKMGEYCFEKNLKFEREPPVEDKEWERFNHYASFTRNLRICELNIHHGIFSALGTRSQAGLIAVPPSRLFPCLESLSIGLAFPEIPENSESDDGTESLRIMRDTLLPFLTPGIRRLSINGTICSESNNFKYLPKVLKLFRVLPSIDTLHLAHLHTTNIPPYTYSNMDCPTEVPLVRDLVLQSRNWKTFHLQTYVISESVLKYLISLPNFKTLSLAMDNLEPDTISLPLQNEIGTASPLRLSLHCSAQDAIRALQLLQGRPMKEITLCIDFRGSQEYWEELAKTSINSCRPLSVKKLEIGLNEDEIQVHMIVDHSPLFAFVNLQALLLSNAPFRFTDDDLKLLANTYKHLKILHLPGKDPRLSTESLTILLTHCAKLDELGISFHGTAEVSPVAIRDVACKAFKEVFRVHYIGNLGKEGAEALHRFVVRLENFKI